MSPNEIKHILDIATIVMVVFIVLAAMAARVYVNRAAKRRTLDINRRWIESLPSMISTLGVLGTFGGITLGLLFFDTNNLNVSIPLLLSGLKTAFFTSLAGMIGSLLLNRKVASLYDKNSGGVKDPTTFFHVMAGYSQSQVNALEEQNKLMQKQSTALEEQNKLLAGMVESVNGKLDVLTQKFEDFSEMLKKSNTDALVEVMEKLTEEFQKQMGTLIERLVQKNFDQLTQSVDRLNLWQQENKNQVATLIQQFKDIESDFETSSTTLKKVSADTQLLVSEGGKLEQLISALNLVVLENKTYLNVAQQLQDAANLTKDNMVKFDDSTSKLNEWVRKQRDFVEGVQLLIAKLEEISQLKDFGSDFWKETRSKMEESVGILKNGSQEIENQLTNLDERFYQRLNATLAQLDACIQSMVKASGYKPSGSGRNPIGF